MKNIHSYQISYLMRKNEGSMESRIFGVFFFHQLWHLATSLRGLQHFLNIVNICMNILNIHTKFHVNWLKNYKDMIWFRIKMCMHMEILEWGEVRVNFQDMLTIFLEWFSNKCQLISISIAPSLTEDSNEIIYTVF